MVCHTGTDGIYLDQSGNVLHAKLRHRSGLLVERGRTCTLSGLDPWTHEKGEGQAQEIWGTGTHVVYDEGTTPIL